MINIKEIIIKSALHYHDRKFATNYDLNIYRGCQHKCQYCFAQYSQDYLNSNFFNDVFVKINVTEILDKELSKKNWSGDLINISGVCDCYQPIEEKYQLMQNILKVLIKHGNPVFILTKSPLILRDIDLIAKLSELTNVYISTTITTLEENIREKIEPNVVSGFDRFEIIKNFSKIKNCTTNVMLMPIIPYLTDTVENIEEIFKLSHKNGAKNLIADVMHMRGNLKQNFLEFLKNNFSYTYDNIQYLYKNAYVSKNYETKLNKFLLSMRKKYGLYTLKTNGLKRKIEHENSYEELDLFSTI